MTKARFLAPLIIILITVSACKVGAAKDNAAQSIQNAISQAQSSSVLPALDTSDSLAGPDADNNGVRDDIDAYINGLTYSPAQKAALRQLSASFSLEITANPLNSAALNAADLKVNRAINCLNSSFDTATFNAMFNTIQKYTFNTKARVNAYLQYSSALNGISPPDVEGNTCD